MAEQLVQDSRRCTYFFLYDGSKVRGEGDLTREGICYFYPEETLLDRQELLCGQLAGVSRCVSELSFSPVRTLRLRRNKFAIRMKDDFFWALGCPAEVPTVSVCHLLDQLIGLFCFYNGSVRQSYQRHSRETLAALWARYLFNLQSGSTELHHIFSSLRTIDSTSVDPLLLLKAALILQGCQRCPLVLTGCILFRGRVVSTQMLPELTMKVMVHESETYPKAQKANGPGTSSPLGGAVSSITVFLTPSELQYLQSSLVDKDLCSRPTPLKDPPLGKAHLSRTLSDLASTVSELSDLGSPQGPQKGPFSLSDSTFTSVPSQGSTHPVRHPALSPPGSNSKQEVEHDSQYYSFQSTTDDQITNEDAAVFEQNRGVADPVTESCDQKGADRGVDSAAFYSPEESPLIPMTLYLHRVKGLVLVLLVEPHFLSDSASMEEVYHSCLASLNGLEVHLRTGSPGASVTSGPYSFAHFDCIRSTLTTNLSARGGAGPERPFVQAASLLHSHFSDTETLQEVIISVAQETYFQQHGGSLRNSGIPNHQDSAFSLPGKARHRLLKHGVNLL